MRWNPDALSEQEPATEHCKSPGRTWKAPPCRANRDCGGFYFWWPDTPDYSQNPNSFDMYARSFQPFAGSMPAQTRQILDWAQLEGLQATFINNAGLRSPKSLYNYWDAHQTSVPPNKFPRSKLRGISAHSGMTSSLNYCRCSSCYVWPCCLT